MPAHDSPTARRPTPSPILRSALAGVRLLIRLYPADFRRRYQRDISQVVCDACLREYRRAGAFAAARRAGRDLLDLFLGGLTAWRTSPPLRAPRSKGAPMIDLTRDLRTAVRSLVRQPTFTAVAVTTLALAIGANTLVFSIVKAALIDPLPYPDAERIVSIAMQHPSEGIDGVSAADLVDVRGQATLIEEIGAYQYWSYTFTEGEEPLDVPAMKVTPELFAVLGAEAQVGRTFGSDEATPGRADVAIVSHGFWQRQWGGDPGVLGRRVELDGAPHTIVGVMPPGFDFPPDRGQDVWTPLAFDPDDLDDRRDVRQSYAIARLAEGADIDRLQEEMDVIAARLAAGYPSTNADWGVRVQNAHEWFISGTVRRPLQLLLGAVAFVLLIACANVANLTLARLTTREREIAVRSALGAGRWQIARHFLAESAVIGVAGGALGLAVASWGAAWVRGLPQALTYPRLQNVDLNPTVLLFTFAVSLAVGLAFGLLPARRAAGAGRLQEGLKESGGSLGAGRTRRVLGILVVGEVALALVLLVGAGLTVRSFAGLMSVDTGFDADNVLAANIFIPDQRYPEDVQQQQFFEQVVERLRSLPGVVAAGAVSAMPMDYAGIDFTLPLTIEGRVLADDSDRPRAAFRVATPGYLESLGIELIRGRDFEPRDRPGAPWVAIVNETFARRYFPDQDPLGERIDIPHGGVNAHEIVGVVRDTRHYGLQSDPQPEMITPFAQHPFGGMVVVAKTAGDPRGLVDAVKQQILSVDPLQPVYAFNTLEELLAMDTFVARLNLILFGAFAGLALLLASVGIYGVLSYAVSQRTREIGLRMALGARTGDTVRLVTGNGLTLVAVGIVIGVAASAALGRLLEGLLYEVDPLDPLVFGGVSAVFVAVALLAAWWPAHRATRVNPIVALRAELE